MFAFRLGVNRLNIVAIVVQHRYAFTPIHTHLYWHTTHIACCLLLLCVYRYAKFVKADVSTKWKTKWNTENKKKRFIYTIIKYSIHWGLNAYSSSLSSSAFVLLFDFGVVTEHGRRYAVTTTPVGNHLYTSGSYTKFIITNRVLSKWTTNLIYPVHVSHLPENGVKVWKKPNSGLTANRIFRFWCEHKRYIVILHYA